MAATDARAIKPQEARTIYHSDYWNAARCTDLPGGVDLAVFDVSVNSGPRRAVRMLQQAIGANLVDGIFGPATMKAVAAMAPGDIVARLDRARRTVYRSLVDRDPSQMRFLVGWLNRVTATTEVAQKMTR